MKISNKLAIFSAAAAISTSAFAGETFHSEKGVLDECEPYWDASRPDSHGPIGVMGDHTHEAGEIMLSYRWMYMSMGGHRAG